MNHIVRPTLAALLCAFSFPGTAVALSESDITGKWCTGGGILDFQAKALIAVRSSDGVRTEFKVMRYEFQGASVTIYWMRDGKNVKTDYAEFSDQNRRMVQLASDEGPRRELHRC